MNGRQRQPMTMPDLTAEAEALIRALRGVRRVRIRTDQHGVSAVHVTATDDEAAENLAAHVRSALLAGLATPIVPGRIRVTVRDEDDDEPADDPRGRVSLLHETDPDAGPGQDRSPTAPDEEESPRPPEAGPAARTDLPPTARPRLVAVDVDRPDQDRVRCRVAIAYRMRVHRAEAATVDVPGAAAQAAAEAAVRALLDAGWDGLELLGLRDVEIAGRDYVIVALRRTDDASTRIRSASAPVIGSHERSAAEAALAAAQETD